MIELRALFNNRVWLVGFVFSLLYFMFSRFYTLAATAAGVSDRHALLMMGFVYLSSSIMIALIVDFGRCHFVVLSGSVFLSLIGLMLSVGYEEILMVVLYLLLSVFNSIVMTRQFVAFSDVSRELGTAQERLVLLSQLLFTLISPVLVLGLGHVAGVSIGGYFGLFLFALSFYFIYCFANGLVFFKKKAQKEYVRLPSLIIVVCSFPFFVNFVRALFVFFYIPLIVRGYSESIKLDSYAFALLGVVVSIASISSMIFNYKFKIASSKSLLFIGAFGGFLIVAVVACLQGMAATMDKFWFALINLTLIVMFEVAARFWSVGYYGFMNDLVSTNEEKSSAFKVYYVIASIGTGLGFIATYFVIGVMTYETVFYVTTTVGSVVLLASLIYINRSGYRADLVG